MKHCKKCLNLKQLDEFYNNKRVSDGKFSTCKACCYEEQKYRYSPEGQKKIKSKKYYRQNKDKLDASRKIWVDNNKEKLKKWHREYAKKRYHEDVDYRLRRVLRSRISGIKTRKSDSHIEYLGCTVKELRDHLESLFKPGMTWDNYGQWQIDHIMPISKAPDLTVACHFTNLQPLWRIDNQKKGNKIVR